MTATRRYDKAAGEVRRVAAARPDDTLDPHELVRLAVLAASSHNDEAAG